MDLCSMKLPHCIAVFYSIIAFQIGLCIQLVWLYKTKPVQGNLELAVLRQFHTPCAQFQFGSRRKSKNVSMNQLKILTICSYSSKIIAKIVRCFALAGKAWLSTNWKLTSSHPCKECIKPHGRCILTHPRNILGPMGASLLLPPSKGPSLQLAAWLE